MSLTSVTWPCILTGSSGNSLLSSLSSRDRCPLEASIQ